MASPVKKSIAMVVREYARKNARQIGPRHRRTTDSSPEDGEFVPQHDDFQFFEIVRPNAQEGELQKPSEQDVTDRDEHDASCVRRNARHILRIGHRTQDFRTGMRNRD